MSKAVLFKICTTQCTYKAKSEQKLSNIIVENMCIPYLLKISLRLKTKERLQISLSNITKLVEYSIKY